jgi:hypothetical protein
MADNSCSEHIMFLKQLRLLIVLFLMLPLIIGCGNPMSFAAPNNSNNDNTQLNSGGVSGGVTGAVVRLVGNQMPMIGQKAPTAKSPEPIKTTVWVFSGRIPSKGTRLAANEAQQNFNLVTQVKTDDNGKFEVKLPPGEYTLFAQYGKDLYLNSFSGDGSFSSVEVNEGKMTQLRLVNSEGAAF